MTRLELAASQGDDVAITVLDDAARERGMRAVDLLTADVDAYVIGNGYGDGTGYGYGTGNGDGTGYGYGYSDSVGGYGDGDGSGDGVGGRFGDDVSGKSISIAGRKP